MSERSDEETWALMSEDAAVVAGLRRRLVIEVERRCAAENEKAVALTELAYVKAMRDSAIKRCVDSEPGIAKVLAQVQEQGVLIDALKAELASRDARERGA